MAAPGAATRPGVTIGVVDLMKVLDAYPKAKQQWKRIDEYRKDRRAALEAEDKKARELRIGLQDLQPGLERDLKEHELRQKLQDIDGMQAVLEREIRRQVDAFYASVGDDVERAIALVAKDRGVALVLRTHPDMKDGGADKARLFESRIVWYAAEEIDLTTAVIHWLQAPLPDEPAKPAAADAPKGGTNDKAGG